MEYGGKEGIDLGRKDPLAKETVPERVAELQQDIYPIVSMTEKRLFLVKWHHFYGIPFFILSKMANEILYLKKYNSLCMEKLTNPF